ncbi:hypothetical protein MKX03_005209 [Papaver bracteatum]|nr:hypothetical protein MKX03_005209 [Papaver bracteatum]
MEDQNLFNTALQIHLIISPITLLALLFIQPPYGKHYRGGWGPTISPSYAWFLMEIFFFHYIHRTLIYPIRLTKSRRNLMAFVYNLLNVYLQSRWVSHYADFNGGGNDWWFWGRFCVGLVVFMSGFAVNVKSDLVFVPKGGMFEFVSCANYFGEILEWFGWMVMIWCGVFFFVYLELVRIIDEYLEKFRDEYPKQDNAVTLASTAVAKNDKFSR